MLLMRNKIIPALIARNQRELDERFDKVKGLSREFHLDVMDGKFVRNKSLLFDFKLPLEKKYSAHLLMKSPIIWIRKNLSKFNMVIVHAESDGVDEAIEYVRKKRKKVGIAINPESSVGKIEKYLRKVDLVLVMSVHPGRYGARFLGGNLEKVKELRRLRRGLDIEVDGGINDKTISLVKRAGANRFVVGGYLQKASDVREAFRKLRGRINRAWQP